MIKDFTPGEWKTDIFYELVWDDGHGNGFGFPCSADGEVEPLDNKDAQANLEYCRSHPEKFARAGFVEKYKNTYREPNRGTCSCGERIELWNEYYGACSCPKCGKWYNLFGQELLPPEDWEEDPSEEEAYEEPW